MRVSNSFLLGLFPSVVLGQGSQSFQTFTPDDRPLLSGNLASFPFLFDLSASLTRSQNSAKDSWWASSYITGRNGDKYFVLTHMMQGLDITTRRSILDLQTLAHVQAESHSDSGSFFNSNTGLADLQGPDFSMVAISDTDPLAGLHVETTVPGGHINITFNSKSPALINAGSGGFVFIGGQSFEWAIPRARTTGTLTVNGTEIEIDPEASFTWFDRQWAAAENATVTTTTYSGAASWHWFQLHIYVADFSDPIPLSGWVIEYANGLVQKFVTLRSSDGIHSVIPIVSLEGSKNWTSPHTNHTYSQQYNLKLEDGSYFDINLITEDQEIHTEDGSQGAYQGFNTFTGVYNGTDVTGYGMMEVLSSYV